MHAQTQATPIRPANGIGPGIGDSTRHAAMRRSCAMRERYAASQALESFILASAPPHYATPDAPDTLDKLRAAAALGGPLPVFDGGCDETIYSRPEVNHAFRAWHDSLHLLHGAAFDLEGERALALEHDRLAEAAGLGLEDRNALWCDLLGQAVYAANHDGAFPEDQAAFVFAAMRDGIDAAALRDF